MKLVPFEIDHLKQIQPRAVDMANHSVFFDEMMGICEDPKNHSFTIMDGEFLVACGGVYYLWPGVGTAWLLGSDHIPKKKIAFHKLASTALDKAIKKGSFHRVQSIVRADFPEALGWNRLLGFEIEGMLKGYAPDGMDCFIYRMGGL